MLPSKASLEMDGQEIELQIQANELAFKVACANLDFHRAQQYRITNQKLKETKTQFHEQHLEDFAQRYGITLQIHLHR